MINGFATFVIAVQVRTILITLCPPLFPLSVGAACCTLGLGLEHDLADQCATLIPVVMPCYMVQELQQCLCITSATLFKDSTQSIVSEMKMAPS